MITLYLPSGEEKHFHHEIDAMEWAQSGLASAEHPSGKKSSPLKTEEKVEEKPEPKTLEEAVNEYAAPGIVGEEAPARPAARKAPRRRTAE